MILYQTDNSGGITNNDIRIYSDFSYVIHFHRDIELVYVDEGELLLTIESKEYSVKHGQMAIVLSNMIHSYESIGHTRVIVHVFSQDNVPLFAKLIHGKNAVCPIFDCDENVKNFYIEYCIKKEKRSPLAIKAVLYAVCNDFYEKSEFVSAKKEGSELIHRMLGYISERYKEEISLVNMAQELGYEPHYLSRVFSMNVKINVRKYINLYRIDNAKERLINTSDSIASIALESGFQSIRNFNRVFLSYTGMTPADYRSSAVRHDQAE
ncbi:MAG: helix-turn-helix transcriptional regulator [Clostridia bacterium]|nr:helix-turn-helix transcriptional regulator [Clostridia bacterium]